MLEPSATPDRPELPKRICSLDSFRFIGALLVVTYHFALYAPGSFPPSLLNGDYPVVDLFFVLSGFVMMHVYAKHLTKPRHFIGFLQNRLARIYPLHLATFLVYLAIGALSWKHLIPVDNPAKYDPAAILPNLLMLHAWGTTRDITFNYPSWSISAEWAAYLVFPLVLWLGRRGGAFALLGFGLAIAAVLQALQTTGYIHADWTTLTSDGGALRALPSFICGAGLFLLVERYRFRVTSFVPVFIMFTIALSGIVLRFDARIVILLFMVLIVLAASAEMHGARGFLTHPLMVYMGDASYAMYMLHPLIGTILVAVIGKRVLGLDGHALAAWSMLAGIGATCIIAPLCYSYFERPVRKSLHVVAGGGTQKKRPPQTAPAQAGTDFAS